MLEIIILAAGASKRLGTSKQLLVIDGETLVYRAAATASQLIDKFQLNKVMVVIGKDQLTVKQALKNLPVESTYNPQWKNGMGSSIATGVSNVRADTSAVLLLTCDQLLVSSDNLQSLIEKWLSNPGSIVASRYNQVLGIPVIFPRRFFRELAELKTDKGARDLLQKYSSHVMQFELINASQDLDTKADEIAVRKLLEK